MVGGGRGVARVVREEEEAGGGRGRGEDRERVSSVKEDREMKEQLATTRPHKKTVSEATTQTTTHCKVSNCKVVISW